MSDTVRNFFTESILYSNVLGTTSRNPGQYAVCADVLVDIGPRHALTVPISSQVFRCSTVNPTNAMTTRAVR